MALLHSRVRHALRTGIVLVLMLRGYGHLKQFTAWGRSCSRKASAVSQIPMPQQGLQNNAWAAVEAALRSRSHLEPHQRFLLCLLSPCPCHTAPPNTCHWTIMTTVEHPDERAHFSWPQEGLSSAELEKSRV